ncbi:MAG: hypothetical protein ACKVJG_15955, partial [Candidatus Latescibacterota bacterium]
MPSFSQRLHTAGSLLFACFASGFAVAMWDPHPRFVLTVTLAITAGGMLLGPPHPAPRYFLR